MLNIENDIIILLLSALVGRLFVPIVLSWINRPILKFQYYDDLLIGHDGQAFHRLLIKNFGRTAAIKCVATLTLSGIVPEKTFSGPDTTHSANAFKTRNRIEDELVCWSKIGNPTEITIYPHSGARVDLLMVEFDSHGSPINITIPTEDGWKPCRIKVIPSHYKGQLVVSGENTPPVSMHFAVVHSMILLGRTSIFLYGAGRKLRKIIDSTLSISQLINPKKKSFIRRIKKFIKSIPPNSRGKSR